MQNPKTSLDIHTFFILFTEVPCHYIGVPVLSETLNNLFMSLSFKENPEFEISFISRILQRMDYCRMVFQLDLAELCSKTIALFPSFYSNESFLQMSRRLFLSYFHYLNKKKTHCSIFDPLEQDIEKYFPLISLIISLLPEFGFPFLYRLLDKTLLFLSSQSELLLKNGKTALLALELRATDSQDNPEYFHILHSIKATIKMGYSRDPWVFGLYLRLLLLLDEGKLIMEDPLCIVDFLALADLTDPVIKPIVKDLVSLCPGGLLTAHLTSDPRFSATDIGYILKSTSSLKSNNMLNLFLYGVSLLLNTEGYDTFMPYLEYTLDGLSFAQPPFPSQPEHLSSMQSLFLSSRLMLLNRILYLFSRTSIDEGNVAVFKLASESLLTILRTPRAIFLPQIHLYIYSLKNFTITLINSPAYGAKFVSILSRIALQINELVFLSKYFISYGTFFFKFLNRSVNVRHFPSKAIFDILSIFSTQERDTLFAQLSPETERPFFKEIYAQYSKEQFTGKA